jgi:hypothetical protein
MSNYAINKINIIMTQCHSIMQLMYLYDIMTLCVKPFKLDQFKLMLL